MLLESIIMNYAYQRLTIDIKCNLFVSTKSIMNMLSSPSLRLSVVHLKIITVIASLLKYNIWLTCPAIIYGSHGMRNSMTPVTINCPRKKENRQARLNKFIQALRNVIPAQPQARTCCSAAPLVIYAILGTCCSATPLVIYAILGHLKLLLVVPLKFSFRK